MYIIQTRCPDMSFHPLRRGLRGVGQFLTFTYQELLVSVFNKIQGGFNSTRNWNSRAWKRISKFSDSSFGNQTQFRVNQSRIRWPLVLVIFSSPPQTKKKRFSKIPILIPVPTESGSSTGSSFRPVLVPEPDPKIRFGSGLIWILVLGFYEPKTSTTDSLTGWSRHLPNIAYAW